MAHLSSKQPTMRDALREEATKLLSFHTCLSDETGRLFLPDSFQTQLIDEIEKGYVSVTEHPELPSLRIFNYTPKAQYERHWNKVTYSCRGLILDCSDISHRWTIVARPFSKIFNLSELRQALQPDNSNPFLAHVAKYAIYYGNREYGGPPPAGANDLHTYSISNKYDGSLGIAFRHPKLHNGELQIATRGSFTSEQAIWANKFLQQNTKLRMQLENFYVLADSPNDSMNPWITPVLEIVYPQNRIVVNYSKFEGLVLLDFIDHQTGTSAIDSKISRTSFRAFQENIIDFRETNEEPLNTNVQWSYGTSNIANWERGVKIQKLDAENVEGVVFTNDLTGVKFKWKCDDYVNKHRICTGLTTWDIWNVMQLHFNQPGNSTKAYAARSQGWKYEIPGLNQIVDMTPDEMFTDISSTVCNLWDQHDRIWNLLTANFWEIMSGSIYLYDNGADNNQRTSWNDKQFRAIFASFVNRDEGMIPRYMRPMLFAALSEYLSLWVPRAGAAYPPVGPLSSIGVKPGQKWSARIESMIWKHLEPHGPSNKKIGFNNNEPTKGFYP